MAPILRAEQDKRRRSVDELSMKFGMEEQGDQHRHLEPTCNRMVRFRRFGRHCDETGIS